MKLDNYFEKRFDGKYEKELNNPTNEKKLREIKFLGYHRGKILDIGCAYGFFMKKAKDAGFEVYGVDVSKKAVAEAKKNTGAKVYLKDICKSTLPLRNLDVCVFLNTLEHLENYLAALQNAMKILKKGGLLFIFVPTGKRWSTDYTHINYFTVESLQFVLTNLGFKVIRIGEEGGIFQIPLGVIRRIIEGDTLYNFVPSGTGSFITCAAMK